MAIGKEGGRSARRRQPQPSRPRAASTGKLGSSHGTEAQSAPTRASSVAISCPTNDAAADGTTGVAGIDAAGPGDHSLGYRSSWPHYKATYWDLGRKSTLDPVMAHRPPSEWGVPHRHHFLSMPLLPPRVFQGNKTLLSDDVRLDKKEAHKTFRQPIPAPTQTLRSVPGEFGAGGTFIKPGTLEKPVRIAVGENTGQKLPPTPPKEIEGDMSRGFKGTEPHFASVQSQLGRSVHLSSEWGVPDKHHFLSMPNCFPKVVHKDVVPDKPKKQEGDYTRGFEGARPHMWTTSWEHGHDPNFKHTRKRYDFAPVAEANYRFAIAREGFPGSSA